MKLFNHASVPVNYTAGSDSGVLQPGEAVELDSAHSLELVGTRGSYVSNSHEGKRLLKYLSFLDDPFGLLRSYHVSVKSRFDLTGYEAGELVVLQQSVLTDEKIILRYDYWTLSSEGRRLISATAAEAELPSDFSEIFEENQKKVRKWDAFWHIILETLLEEGLGLGIVAFLVSLVWDSRVWGVWAVLMAISFAVNALLWWFGRGRVRDEVLLQQALLPERILRSCYPGISSDKVY